jgi:hypothetical protein
MYLLPFFSRVVFIFNLCYLVAIIIQRIPNPPQGEFISLIIVLGYPVAIIANGVINIINAIFLIFAKRLLAAVPRWLVIVNFIFLIIQLIFFFK